MEVLVVYESSFGNTRELAEVIAAELEREDDVTLCSTEEPLPPLDGIELLVVGAPTQVHGLSSATSRRGAREQANRPPDDVGIGMRGWLDELGPGEGRHAACFDTRFEKPAVLVGSAARGIAKRLRRRGYLLIADPESFFVTGGQGPLKPGELDRAAAWAQTVRSHVHTHRDRSTAPA
jgi:hypothetical protein